MTRLARVLQPVNWKYALGEIFLIVAGVLIALALDAWADGRADRRRERAYLVQLLTDTRVNERRILRTIAEDRTSFEAGLDRVLRAARAPGPVHPDSLGVYLGFSEFSPLTGTVTALIQSGGVDLVRNDSVRLQLISFAAAMDEIEQLLEGTAQATVRNVEAWNRREWANRRGDGAVRWRADLDWEALLRDPEVLAIFDMQRDGIRVRRFGLCSLLDPTRRLRRALEDELGQPSPAPVPPETTGERWCQRPR